MKKRVFAVLLCLSLVLSAVACGEIGKPPDTASSENCDSTSSVTSVGSADISSNASTDTFTSSVVSSADNSTVSSTITSSVVTSSKEELKVPEWKSHPEDYKLIAFTFDDAPNTGNPNSASDPNIKIINAFKNYEGAGTLFVTGKNVRSKGYKVLQYAVDCGFELGNHTDTHPDYTTLDQNYRNMSADEYYELQIKPLNDLVYNNVFEADGKTPYTMKFARSSNLFLCDGIKAASEKYDMPLIGRQKGNGELDNNTDNATYTQNVLNNVSDGAIVLMHTWSNKSADTLENILRVLYDDDYRFCTLSELFRYKLGVTDLSKIDVVKSCETAPASGGIGHISEVKLD